MFLFGLFLVFYERKRKGKNEKSLDSVKKGWVGIKNWFNVQICTLLMK